MRIKKFELSEGVVGFGNLFQRKLLRLATKLFGNARVIPVQRFNITDAAQKLQTPHPLSMAVIKASALEFMTYYAKCFVFCHVSVMFHLEITSVNATYILQCACDVNTVHSLDKDDCTSWS